VSTAQLCLLSFELLSFLHPHIFHLLLYFGTLCFHVNLVLFHHSLSSGVADQIRETGIQSPTIIGLLEARVRGHRPTLLTQFHVLYWRVAPEQTKSLAPIGKRHDRVVEETSGNEVVRNGLLLRAHKRVRLMFFMKFKRRLQLWRRLLHLDVSYIAPGCHYRSMYGRYILLLS